MTSVYCIFLNITKNECKCCIPIALVLSVLWPGHYIILWLYKATSNDSNKNQVIASQFVDVPPVSLSRLLNCKTTDCNDIWHNWYLSYISIDNQK